MMRLYWFKFWHYLAVKGFYLSCWFSKQANKIAIKAFQKNEETFEDWGERQW